MVSGFGGDSPTLHPLKVGYWEYLEQISTVTVTFFQESFVLATFVYIRNKSAVTDPILAKL